MRTIRKVAAIVLRGGHLLVVRKRGSSIFLSPGGKPERGETARQALARELAEETTLELWACEPFGVFTDKSALEAATDVRVEVFRVEADGVATPNAEIEELAWINAGYRENGIELGSIFERFVVPELLAAGLLRQHGRVTAEHTIVVADLDGTLTFDGNPPAPEVVAALRELARRADIRLVFATSRAPRGARGLLGVLADHADLLCCNGSIEVVDGTITRCATLPAAVVRAVVELLRAKHIGFYVEYGDHYVVDGGGFPWMAYPDRHDLAEGESPPTEGAVKLVVDPAEPGRPSLELRELTGANVELHAHTNGVVDITPAGVTKANAVTRWRVANDSAVIAFGNDRNDQELLSQADLAVVVGDGLPGLERAGHVRRIPAQDAAVAAALRDVVDSRTRAEVVNR